VKYAEIARREGLLALAEQRIRDPFMQKAIQLVVDGTKPALIDSILQTEISFLRARHRTGQQLFKGMGTYAPAFGMIGTLIGLINMLRTMEDPSSIGPAMALAILTTLYGALLANLIFLPIADKLAARSDEEILLMEVVIEGVRSLQAGDPPTIVEEKLHAFLSPKLRESKRRGAAKKR